MIILTKEELIVLGIPEEQAEKVAQTWTEGLKGYVQKADHTTLEAAKTALETQLGGVENLVKALVKDAKGSTLEEQINSFQQSIQTDKDTARKQLEALRFDHALERALSAAKAKNAQAVRALLKQDNLKLNDDGSVTGLDEQIKAIRKSDAYMFDDNSGGGGTGSEGNFGRRYSNQQGDDGIGKRLAEASKSAGAEPENPYFN